MVRAVLIIANTLLFSLWSAFLYVNYRSICVQAHTCSALVEESFIRIILAVGGFFGGFFAWPLLTYATICVIASTGCEFSFREKLFWLGLSALLTPAAL